MGLTVSGHPLAELRPWLRPRGFISAAQMKSLEAGSPVRLAGEVIIIHTPPQRNADRVIFATLEDETGLIDLALFPRDQGGGNTKALLAHPLVLVWGTLSRRGRKDALVVATRISGPPLPLPHRVRAAPRGR
jgi:DNA polymerase III alpha subunit